MYASSSITLNNLAADHESAEDYAHAALAYVETLHRSEMAEVLQAIRATIGERYGIAMPTFRAEEVAGTDADKAQWSAGATHWCCTFTRQGHKPAVGSAFAAGGMLQVPTVRRMSIPYHMGAAHNKPPTMWEVLSCLFMDAQSAEESFENWAADMGMETDSRKALATFKACQSIGKRLRALLGDDFGTFHELSRDV